MHRLHSTSQYCFSKGMTEFKEERYYTYTTVYPNLVITITMDAVEMLGKKKITKGIYVNALTYLLFLKRKKSSDVKARGCASCRPQRNYILKEQSSAPIVSTYALFISCVSWILMKKANVYLVISQGYSTLQADWPRENDCYLKFEDLMMKMVCKIGPEYEKYVLASKNTGQKAVWHTQQGHL